MTFIRTASTLNVVALGLVAGLVAFITFQFMGPEDPIVMGPEDPIAAGDDPAPVAQESELDNVHGDPPAMPWR